jgi:hypothetical protein
MDLLSSQMEVMDMPSHSTSNRQSISVESTNASMDTQCKPDNTAVGYAGVTSRQQEKDWFYNSSGLTNLWGLSD